MLRPLIRFAVTGAVLLATAASAAGDSPATKPENTQAWARCIECIRLHSDPDEDFSVKRARDIQCKDLCDGLVASDGSRPGDQALEDLDAVE